MWDPESNNEDYHNALLTADCGMYGTMEPEGQLYVCSDSQYLKCMTTITRILNFQKRKQTSPS